MAVHGGRVCVMPNKLSHPCSYVYCRNIFKPNEPTQLFIKLLSLDETLQIVLEGAHRHDNEGLSKHRASVMYSLRFIINICNRPEALLTPAGQLLYCGFHTVLKLNHQILYIYCKHD